MNHFALHPQEYDQTQVYGEAHANRTIIVEVQPAAMDRHLPPPQQQRTTDVHHRSHYYPLDMDRMYARFTGGLQEVQEPDVPAVVESAHPRTVIEGPSQTHMSLNQSLGRTFVPGRKRSESSMKCESGR